MNVLSPDFEQEFDAYMEKWFEFQDCFKSKVVSALVIDPKGKFPLSGLKLDGLRVKYFDLKNLTEKDYHLIGSWITQRINNGTFSYDGLLFDNADHIPTDWEDEGAEYNLEQMLISALKREDDFQILPNAFPCAPIPFDKIMVAVRCKEYPKYLWGKSLQSRIIEVE